jgi:hypothetical protein
MKKSFLSLLCVCMIVCACCSKSDNYTDEEIASLKSVPYVSWADNSTGDSIAGVVTYKKEKAFPGYNLYFNQKDRAFLMAMDGTIVHTWFLPFHNGVWEYGILKDNGNLVADCIDQGVTEIDWNSHPLWYTAMRAHHDVEMLADGSYLVPDTFKKEYRSRTILFNTIKHLSPKGKVIDEWSTWDDFAEIKRFHGLTTLDSEPVEGEIESETGEYDYFHLNTIKLLPSTPLEARDNRFKEGNWLICLRNVDLVLILDKTTKEIIWDWGPGDLDWPHMPVMLDNGDILIFDNGVRRGYSRIVQLDPVTETIKWEYRADPPEKFHSPYWGSVQRMPNGNTLITNSEHGQVFEVTEKGEIVWNYFNPEIMNDMRKKIYRMIRYPAEMIEELIEKNHEESREVAKVKNPGFEREDAKKQTNPGSWKYSAWIYETSKFILDNKTARSGNKSAKIVLNTDNTGYWCQFIHVESQSRYRLSGWIKTEKIPVRPGKPGAGAALGVEMDNRWPVYSNFVTGSHGWTKLTCEFSTGYCELAEIQCAIGSNGAETTGTVWFDDIRLQKIQ